MEVVGGEQGEGGVGEGGDVCVLGIGLVGWGVCRGRLLELVVLALLLVVLVVLLLVLLLVLVL